MKTDSENTVLWNEYQKGIAYKQSIDLFETVKKNENFFVGKQWEGLNVSTLDPLIFNVLKRVVNLFVSMVVSDDIAVFTSTLDYGEKGRKLSSVLDDSLERVIDRSGAKAKNRHMLRNCCVDGDGCFYIYFDQNKETGQEVTGDISIDIIDNVNIYFGNIGSDDVQSQPYIIIAMRREVEEVKVEARENGIDERDIMSIISDTDEKGMTSYIEDNKVTVLLKMQKKGGRVVFTKATKNCIVMPPKESNYRLYPLAYMSWDRVKNSCHGYSPITSAIPNQIAINKLYSMYVQCIKQIAFPKVIYDMNRFPNGYSGEVGKAIGMRGNPNEAIISAFRAPDISSRVMEVISRMIKDTMELMGASDVMLGNVRPDNTSAIIAIQKATVAPLELVRMEFYRFVEDYVNIFLDMMRVHYGIRNVTVRDDNGDEKEEKFDFSSIGDIALRLKVNVGASSYWSETMQTVTNDNLLSKGIITDPLVYVENIPDSYIRGKGRIIKSLKEQKEKQQEKNSYSNTLDNALKPLRKIG
jgi:hypothetical protein